MNYNYYLKMGKILKVQVVDMDDDKRAQAEEQILAAFANFSKEEQIA